MFRFTKPRLSTQEKEPQSISLVLTVVVVVVVVVVSAASDGILLGELDG